MEQFQIWAAGLCVLAIGITLVQACIPNSAMQKTLGFVLGLVLLLSMVQPIREIFQKNWTVDSMPNFSLQLSDSIEIANSAIYRQVEQEVQKLAIAELNKQGIDFTDIQLSCGEDADGNLVLEQLTVTLPLSEKAQQQQAKSTLETVLEIPTEVWIYDAGMETAGAAASAEISAEKIGQAAVVFSWDSADFAAPFHAAKRGIFLQ